MRILSKARFYLNITKLSYTFSTLKKKFMKK